MKIQFAKYELLMAAGVGVWRRVESMGIQSAFDPKYDWSSEIESACAELAAAKALNLYWDGSVNTFKAPDLPGNIQVRHTEHLNGRLIVREGDSDDHIFLLVVGKVPSMHVIGWLLGAKAKQDRFLMDPNGRGRAWFVPQGCLLMVEELTRTLRGERRQEACVL